MNSVQVLCPNGRRVNIKVSPNTPLLSVLEDACKKQGFDPRQHVLKHQRKTLDMSQMFRYSGLPNNTKLEVVTSSHLHPRKEQSVRVAVQMQSGDRLQGVFPSTVSLWDLMCSLHGNDRWINNKAVIVYMRREVHGEDELKGTSLKDLGVDYGSVVLRLIHRLQQDNTMDTSEVSSTDCSSTNDVIMEHSGSHDEAPNAPVISGSHDVNTTRDLVATESHDPTDSSHSVTTEPVASISCDLDTSGSHDPTTSLHTTISSDSVSTDPVALRSCDPDVSVSKSHDTTEIARDVVNITTNISNSGSHDSTTVDQVATGSHDLSSCSHESHSSPSNTVEQDKVSCDREVVVFNMADQSSVSTPVTELPDSFFEVTVNDCVAMQQDLQMKVKKLADAPLTTGALRQAALHDRYSQYNKAVVRIQFPGHWVLQGSFQPHESLRALVKFVRQHLANPAVKFYLYTTPPKTILTNAKLTLAEAGLVPASIVHFGLHDNKDGKELLKTSSLEQAVSSIQADVVAMRTRDVVAMTTQDKPSHRHKSPTVIASSNAVQRKDYGVADGTVNRDTSNTKQMPKWFKHSGGKKL